MVASIDLAIFDKVLGTTISDSTSVTYAIYQQPTEQRDFNASKLVVQKNKTLKKSEPEIRKAIHKILENPDSSEQLKKDNLIIVMNSNFYGSAIGGVVQQANFAFIQEWNQKKNEIDLDLLRTELEKAIILMQKEAKKDNHYKDLAQVIFAIDELKKADGPTMLKHLRKVGEFGLDIIKSMGVSILSQLIIGG